MADLLSLLFPPRCVFCQRVLKNDEFEVCGDCKKSHVISDLAVRLPLTEGCIAPLKYEGDVRRAILRFKFRGKKGYAVPFARYMDFALRRAWAPGWDLITFVVSNPSTVRKRGYNQAELLAKELSVFLGIPYAACLKKKHDTAPMNALTAAQRAANISGAFECADPNGIRGKRLLLIDDILTTGVTLTECSRTLLSAGAVSIHCAVCARTVK